MAIKDVGAVEAKTHLSELLEKVRKGETYYITRRGRRIAELRPSSQGGRRLHFGCDLGRVKIGPDFDTPLPDMAEYTQ